MRSNRAIHLVFAFVFAAFAMIGSAGATSANTDLTDLWWNPSESGWGIQMVNTGTYVFVTVYAYGSDGRPTWFGGGLDRTASNTFTGKLYVTTGPYFGGPFNPAAVNVREAGTMTFVATTSDAGQFTYTVDGVAVNKAVQRQPLPLDSYDGSYISLITITATNCFDPALNGSDTGLVEITISQSGQSMSQVWNLGDVANCQYDGTYSQLGRMGRFDAHPACGVGQAASLTMYEMNNLPNMFTARFVSLNSQNGCTAEGEITGLVPR